MERCTADKSIVPCQHFVESLENRSPRPSARIRVNTPRSHSSLSFILTSSLQKLLQGCLLHRFAFPATNRCLTH